MHSMGTGMYMLIDLEKYTLHPRTLVEFDLTLTQNHIEHIISSVMYVMMQVESDNKCDCGHLGRR